MTEESSPPRRPQTMSERYGEPRAGRRRVAIVVIALVCAALLAWLLWAAWRHAHPDVKGRLRSFEVVSPHRIEVTLSVYRAGTEAVKCTLTAQAADHAVVGERVVRLPPGKAGDHVVRTTLRTDRAATTAMVMNCR